MPAWTAQPFPPQGATTAEGLRRQLGTPKMEILEVLVREAAQNSWDARIGDPAPSFSLSIGSLGSAALEEWRSTFRGGPAQLDKLLSEDTVDVLLVGDRSTTGLGGPIRAGMVANEPPDFVNFVRNSGEVRDTDFGGGTYGFGKGAYYRASRVSTILVDTACQHEGRIQRRLIGCALAPAFDDGDRRYTGRFFWGLDKGGVTDPLIDDDAAIVADRLGLPGFGRDETGTDIVVVGLDNGIDVNGKLRTTEDVAAFLASACLWNLWPKMLARSKRNMKIRVSHNGQRLNLPAPPELHRLAPFVEAISKIDNGEADACTRKRRPTAVGSMATIVEPAVPGEPDWVRLAQPFEGPAHHCARMRNAELVVDYIEGPDLGTDLVQYGAVFRSAATLDVDQYFADAEPPTHDAWVLKHLSGTARGVVQGAGTFVRKNLEQVASEFRPGGPRGFADVPLGGLSSRLASALPGGHGQGGESGGASRSGSPKSSSVRKTRYFTIINGPFLRVGDHGRTEIVTTCRFEVPEAERSFRSIASAVTDAGRERSAPLGAAGPEPLRWETTDGSRIQPGQTLTLAPGDPLEWNSVVLCPPDVAADVAVSEVDADD